MNKGLMVEGYVDANISPETGGPVDHPDAKLLDLVRMKMMQEALRHLSVGIRILAGEPVTDVDPITGSAVEAFKITALEWLETSLTYLPVSAEAEIGLLSFLRARYGDDVAESLCVQPKVFHVEPKEEEIEDEEEETESQFELREFSEALRKRLNPQYHLSIKGRFQ